MWANATKLNISSAKREFNSSATNLHVGRFVNSI
jgi:hypothetical protein